MGDFDFLLVFNVCDMVEYEVFICEFFFFLGNIKFFKMIVVM